MLRGSLALVFGTLLAVGCAGSPEEPAVGEAPPAAADRGAADPSAPADRTGAPERRPDRAASASDESRKDSDHYRSMVQAALRRSATDRALTPDEVQAIKGATVLIRSMRGSGSGFVFRRTDDGHLVATNHHVVEGVGKPPYEIEVVVNSGGRDQTSVRAEVVGSDPHSDLAVLRCRGLPADQPLLDVRVDDIVYETQPIVVAGFPFGEMLAKAGSPAPTLGRGSVSSLRYDERGELFRVQLDADVNPGNSGGPVIDTGGFVVGVAVESMSATNISFMVPISRLHALLDGYVFSVHYEAEDEGGGRAIEVTFETLDPLGRIARLGLNAMTAGEPLTEEMATRPWRALGREVAASRPVSERTVVRLRLPRSVEGFAYLQPFMENAAGTRYLPPFQIHLLGGAPQSGTLEWDAQVGPATDDSIPEWLTVEKERPLDEDWLGGTGAVERIPEIVAEADQWSFKPRDQRQVGDASVATIQASSDGLLDSLTWSSDHQAFFVLREQGVLHRVSFPSFVEEYRLDLWEPASALQRSKLGLVIATPESGQVRVVDEATLQTTRVMFVPGVYWLASAAPLSVAYAVPRNATRELSVIDLGRKRVVRTLNAGKIWYQTRNRVSRHEQGVALTDFRHPTVSPDGKYLFCLAFECLHRFRISGTSLEYEQMGPRLGGASRIEISPDGRYVALPTAGGSRNLADHPQLPGYSVFVYRTLNLLQPVVGVSPGASPTALGFDPSRGNLYVNNRESQLVTMDARGRQRDAYLLTEKGDQVRQFLPHPNGRDLLVLTRKKLLWVSWS